MSKLDQPYGRPYEEETGLAFEINPDRVGEASIDVVTTSGNRYKFDRVKVVDGVDGAMTLIVGSYFCEVGEDKVYIPRKTFNANKVEYIDNQSVFNDDEIQPLGIGEPLGDA